MKYSVCLFLAAVALAIPAPAEVVTNESIPEMIDVFIPCANGGAGELVSLSGDIHILTAVQTDANGALHVKQHAQPQGISGLGMTTGDVYRGTGVTQETLFEANPTFPVAFTFVNNFKIIGQGRGNNFFIHEVFHITIDANGEVSTEVEHLSEEC